MRTALNAAAAAAADTFASAGLVSASAVSAKSAAERRPPITAHPSDHTPRVGAEFAVRGIYDGPGPRAHDVKVQTFRDNRWLDLDGARVTTRSDGDVEVRVSQRASA